MTPAERKILNVLYVAMIFEGAELGLILGLVFRR